MKALRTIKTASEVVKELGGTSAVALLTDRTLPAVSNWRKAGAFPPDTFLVLTQALAGKRATAPASLWGMRQPVLLAPTQAAGATP